jgi:hypothetical protein
MSALQFWAWFKLPYIEMKWNVFQERSLALAENKPEPELCSSADIRPLKMEDFRYAHEQVC